MVAEKQERQTASVIIKKWGRNRVFERTRNYDGCNYSV